MCDCRQSPGIAFFDSIAPKWDSWEDLESLDMLLGNGLRRFGLRPDEHVLDVGCGTGNLTAAIVRQLSAAGRVVAIDLSSKMIEIARTKEKDSRVTWICDAVEHHDFVNGPFDRIICYSVWPHLTDPAMAARMFHTMLKTGGKLHVWHTKAREVINKIHAEASEAVSDHILAPASQTAALLGQSGFIIEETQDDDSGYLVSARKV